MIDALQMTSTHAQAFVEDAMNSSDEELSVDAFLNIIDIDKQAQGKFPFLGEKHKMVGGDEIFGIGGAEETEEYKKIKVTEKELVSVLSKSMSQPESINRALREIDIKIFSEDHGWRAIIGALHAGSEELNDFRHIGVAKYLQYLSSIQEILRELYSEKKKERTKRN